MFTISFYLWTYTYTQLFKWNIKTYTLAFNNKNPLDNNNNNWHFESKILVCTLNKNNVQITVSTQKWKTHLEKFVNVLNKKTYEIPNHPYPNPSRAFLNVQVANFFKTFPSFTNHNCRDSRQSQGQGPSDTEVCDWRLRLRFHQWGGDTHCPTVDGASVR